MQHILFGSDIDDVDIAILIKDSCLNKQKLLTNYIFPSNIPSQNFIAFNLEYQPNNKAPALFAKNHLANILPDIVDLNITTLLVADAIYFKFLTGKTKTEPWLGYVLPCSISGFTHLKIILTPNYQAILFNPNQQKNIDLALQALRNFKLNIYKPPGLNILKIGYYPKEIKAIKAAFRKLHTYTALTCDIEGLSLDFWSSGISTIAFAWNSHEGIAIPINRDTINPFKRRQLLLEFLSTYRGTLIYHNAGFDIKVLVFELWMRNLQDYPGMITGIHKLTRKFEDTKLIAYAATNNAVQNKLGLKDLSLEFAGNYAEDVTDTSLIPINKLLKYNLTDCLATWYVYNKYKPIMITDQQEDLYETFLKPSVITLLQTELCGIPISPGKVFLAKTKLENIVNQHLDFFEKSYLIKNFHKTQITELIKIKTTAAKKKVYTINDPVIQKFKFNPNSDTQLRKLIYEYWKYPVIDKTKSKQPSTGTKTLKKLLVNAQTPDHKKVFENLIELSQANIILTTFIPAFENAQQLPDGSWRLYGNFNLGGTQSLRLSSSNPNLQNIPSHSVYAKIIKDCFISDIRWIFMGSDFDSLEDKIGALLSKDPNKLKVYTDGYDGHSLRAFTYYDLIKKGIKNTVKSINSIETLFPDERQESKAPTFALSYKGTFITLMNNCGFSKKKAKEIEAKYHQLYKVADAWLAGLLKTAEKIGYIPLCFGGRIRTPLIAQSIGNTSQTPYSVKKEERSAGNAATQSYCALTMRAFNEFRERVWASPYKYQILPSATIHDAIYVTAENNTRITEWINTNLIECMAWQKLPEIQHPTIRITSGMEVYWPNWNSAIKIPNEASTTQIKTICRKVENKVQLERLLKKGP